MCYETLRNSDHGLYFFSHGFHVNEEETCFACFLKQLQILKPALRAFKYLMLASVAS